MSSKCNDNNTNTSSPFGFIKEPYRRTSFGYNFSMKNRFALAQRGFSDKFLSYMDSQTNYEKTRAAATAIRGNKPRQVDITHSRPLTDAETQTMMALETQIKDNKRLLEYNRNLLVTQPDNQIASNIVGSLEAKMKESMGVIDSIKAAGAGKKTINGINFFVNEASGNVGNNALNCYVDVQYHISLTMISEKDAKDYQNNGVNQSDTQIDINTMKATSKNRRSITLASTGDTLSSSNGIGGASIVSSTTQGPLMPNQVFDSNLSGTSRDYYNITKMSLDNLMAPSLDNPLISSMISMKLSIAEPHGFKLHEDIKDAGILLGYTDINPGRLVYRVDLYFSGYDQDTGDWIEQIDISNGSGASSISYMMSITDISAEVSSSGTVYELDLMPVSHQSWRPEDFTVDAMTINSGATFREFLDNFATALSTAKEARTKTSEVGSLIRHYEFYGPPALLDSKFDVVKEFNQEKQIYQSANPDHIISQGAGVDILTTLQGAMENTLVVQELFNVDNNNDDFLIPRVMFSVRFNTIYGQRLSNPLSINDYKEVTHQYIIEPFITYKSGPVSPSSIDAYVDPQNQLLRVREIVRMGMLRRIYNYTYTGENTEVIDFKINLTAFYYNTLNISDQNQSSGGISASEAVSKVINRKNIQNNLATITRNGDNFIAVDNTIKRIFGNYKYDVSGTKTGADRLGGGFNDGPNNAYFGDTTSPAHKARNDYTKYMSDYLSMDLLGLDGMAIRGDPVWLLSPYGNVDVGNMQKISDIGGAGVGNSNSAIQVYPRTDQIIFLKILPPEQTAIMEVDRKQGSAYPSIIGGFYNVTSVTSAFENGKFTQSLQGIKMDHLNYVEELFERSGSRSGTPIGGNSSYRETSK